MKRLVLRDGWPNFFWPRHYADSGNSSPLTGVRLLGAALKNACVIAVPSLGWIGVAVRSPFPRARADDMTVTATRFDNVDSVVRWPTLMIAC
jgi:hypothetical protein